MPWKTPSSQPTSWAWAIRSSASDGVSPSLNGSVIRSSSSRSSGARPCSSSRIEEAWMSRSRLRLASSRGAARTSSSSCLIIVPIRMTLAGCSTMSLMLPPPSPSPVVAALSGTGIVPTGRPSGPTTTTCWGRPLPLSGAVMPPSSPASRRPAGAARVRSDRRGQRLGSRPMGSGEGRLDVARVRGLFPGLSDGLVHAEGSAGALLPENVVVAVAQAMRMPVADRGGVFPASARAERLVASARTAVADLVGGVSTGVVLGPDPSRLTWAMARALARTWRPGDEVVVSRLDHDANVRPWVELAARAGVAVRWTEVDIETGELPDWQYDELLGPRTRLFAVTAASSAIGTRPDVAAIARRAHAVGGLVYVDGTHAAAHDLLDVGTMGADFLVVAADMWCGPHVGAVVADPGLLAELEPEKLAPVPD